MSNVIRNLGTQMNWRAWRLGFLIAVFCGLLTAGAGLAGTMDWKSFIAVLCTSMITNLGNFLKQHPVESISFETSTLKRNEITPPAP
jgi:hypothetical protein